MFQNLSKKETKELANETTPLQNLLENPNKYLPVPSWYRAHGLDPDKPSQHWKKLDELLGKRTYGCNGSEGRMQVWGRAWNLTPYSPYNKFIVYNDKRGTIVEVHSKFRKDQLNRFLQELLYLIY